MRDHVRILGILNIVMGSLTVLVGVIALIALGSIAGVIGVSAGYGGDANGAAAAPILALIGFAAGIFFLVLGLPSIIGGWGILSFRPWARILMIVVSVLDLFHIPIGTALGVYGLWVLLSDETRLLFDRRGQVPVMGPGGYPGQAVGAAGYPGQTGYPAPQPQYPPTQTPPGV